MDTSIGYISRRKVLGASRFVNIEQTEKSRQGDSRQQTYTNANMKALGSFLKS